jgi:hypothetical protein
LSPGATSPTWSGTAGRRAGRAAAIVVAARVCVSASVAGAAAVTLAVAPAGTTEAEGEPAGATAILPQPTRAAAESSSSTTENPESIALAVKKGVLSWTTCLSSPCTSMRTVPRR